MPRLGVNIDHVATIRQARGGREPDPVWAAAIAELAGAEGITVHLREDRRHIQDRDLRLLRETVSTRLNLELAIEPAVVTLALETRPDQLTFVPERREELTTEGGLDVLANEASVAAAVERLLSAGIEVSLFIDPVAAQIDASKRLGARGRQPGEDAGGAPQAAGHPGRSGPAREVAGLAGACGARTELPQRAGGGSPA
jgi:pyridoxine 5-phosphate synthase